MEMISKRIKKRIYRTIEYDVGPGKPRHHRSAVAIARPCLTLRKGFSGRLPVAVHEKAVPVISEGRPLPKRRKKSRSESYCSAERQMKSKKRIFLLPLL